MISTSVPIWFLCVFTHAVGSWSPFGCSEALAWIVCYVWWPSMTGKLGLIYVSLLVRFVWFHLQNGPVINLERSLKADALIHTATQLCSLSAWSDHLWPDSPDPALTLVSFFWIPLPVSVLPAALFCLRALHDALLIWHHAWGPPSAGICNVFILEFLAPHSAGHSTIQLMCLFCRKIGYWCLKLRKCRNSFHTPPLLTRII